MISAYRHPRWPVWLALVVAIAGLLLGSACQHRPSTPASQETRLYDALGGRAGISELTETLLLEVAADPRLKSYFVDTDIVRLHRLLTEQFCQVAGGPCEYTGRDMAHAHAGMNITSTAFNALVADLITAMDRQQIPLAAQNALLARLAPMRPQIVDVPRPEQNPVGDALGVDRPHEYSAKPLNPGL